MPFKAPENPKCPKCSKSVYHAEARTVGDVSFHKECYKCSMCNKMLDSTNSNMHENVLYCKTCHGRKFGPKGYGFGGGAAGLSMDTGAHLDRRHREDPKPYKPPMAAPGEGCPRCGGKVFAAEEMLAKGKSYHRTCFNCKNCRKPLDSVVHCDGPDNHVYCKVCYGKAFGPKGYGFGSGAGTLTCGYEDLSPIVRPHGNPNAILPVSEGECGCPRCGGKVFTAELMLAKGRPYHKQCFKCKVCKRPLDSMVHCDGPDSEIYCKLCYAKKYGPKGYGFAGGSGGVLVAENIPGGEDMPGVRPSSAALDVTAIKAEEGQGCPRCGGKVFMAEEINARGRSFHKRCYNCCYCHRPLDSVTGCDSPDGEVYCKLCYAKKYGPKGYGFAAGGGGVLVAENISGGDDTSKADAKKADTGRLDVGKIQAEEGKGCPRCGGKVFMAEEMHARGRSYHKRCYNCANCHRPLDSMVGCDAPDNEIYCKLCYAKKYGPKGYGFAAGCGGVLVAENIPGGRNDEGNDAKALKGSIDTACIQAAPGEGCPRCGGKVFTAEERLSRNKRYHKRCYTCRECYRPLDSMVLCDAPDGDVYCKLCYAKKYGPKGYGFAAGAGGVLVPENYSADDDIDYLGTGESKGPTTKAAFTVLDVTKFPAKEGQSRCPRCAGAVFQAEAMPCRGKEWHKRCYNCCLCHRPLDSMLSCDAPDGEIYCKLCYAKRHGPKGYGFGHTPALVSLGTEDGAPMPTDIRQFGFDGKGPHPEVPLISRPKVCPPTGPPNFKTPSGFPTPVPPMLSPEEIQSSEPPRPRPKAGPPSGPPSFKTPSGMPTPVLGCYPPKQGAVAVNQAMSFQQASSSSSSQQSSQQISVQQSSSSQEFSSVQRTETRVVQQVQQSSSSSSRSFVESSGYKADCAPIVAGVHMDEGSPVPIVSGVSQGERNVFKPSYPDERMIIPEDNTVYQDPQANIPPEMLADMVAHQSAMATQNNQMMIANQHGQLPPMQISNLKQLSEISTQNHSTSAISSSSTTSHHHHHQQQQIQHTESVKMQQMQQVQEQMQMSASEVSSSSMSEAQLMHSQFAASDPMLDSQPAFVDPDFEPQTNEHEVMLPEPGVEPQSPQELPLPPHPLPEYPEDEGEYLDPDEGGFPPGAPEEEELDASDM